MVYHRDARLGGILTIGRKRNRAQSAFFPLCLQHISTSISIGKAWGPADSAEGELIGAIASPIHRSDRPLASMRYIAKYTHLESLLNKTRNFSSRVFFDYICTSYYVIL